MIVTVFGRLQDFSSLHKQLQRSNPTQIKYSSAKLDIQMLFLKEAYHARHAWIYLCFVDIMIP